MTVEKTYTVKAENSNEVTEDTRKKFLVPTKITGLEMLSPECSSKITTTLDTLVDGNWETWSTLDASYDEIMYVIEPSMYLSK
jgi:hypothetical protein